MNLKIQDMAQIFLHTMTGFIPAVLFYSCIAMAVIRAKISNQNTKPAEFYPNKHIYYPQRVFPFFKVVIYVATAIFFCFALPYMAMFISFIILRSVAFPVAAIVFVFGLLIAIKIIKRPDGSAVESITVDSSELTVKYRGGSTEKYVCRQYAGYNNAGASGTVLAFRDENGAEIDLSIGSLTDWDNNMLKSDLERVRQTGNIAEMKKPVYAKEAGIQTAQTAQQKREEYYTDPANYERHLQRVADKLMPDKKEEIIKFINEGENLRAITVCHKQTDCSISEARDIVASYKKYLLGISEQTGPATYEEMRGMGLAPVRSKEEMDAISADPLRYAAYLKEEAGKLSAERRQELVALIESGDVMNAIKRCRELTHLGLKQAKDIVDSYQTCLLDDDAQSIAAVTPVVAPAVTPVAAAVVSQPVMPAEIPTVTPEVTSMFTSQITPAVTPISGFGFDMPGTVPNSGPWTLRITDNEQSVTDARSLERTIDNALSDIGRKNEEFFVLAPAEPQRGISFMQVCQDKNDVYFHLEAGLTEKNAAGRPKILCKDKLMGWEARNICISFYRGDDIYMSDWYELG